MNPFDDPDGIVVVPVGETKHLNLTFGIFFDEHDFPARFIGLYEEKGIFAIGRITDVVRRHPDGRIECFCATSVYPACIEAIKVLSGKYG